MYLRILSTILSFLLGQFTEVTEAWPQHLNSKSPMAASISNVLIALPKTQHKASFRSNHPKLQAAPLPLSRTQNSLSTRKPIVTSKALSEANSSLSSTITELSRDQEQEQEPEQEKHPQKPVTDDWRKIHGEDNWVGLLDPMDPLMRLELIRYGEMAQACYDAFDFDPCSKYCGSCRYPHQQFFESLDMTHLGYKVTRYLYATANINLPNFFKKSRWPNTMWSKHANWAGYIAVSDDATSKRLGRRDITVAWRGTVTHLEWVTDLMDFLKPISSKNIPCPDEAVKVEAGFLDLYTDREKSCGYCKYSAREQVLTEVKRLVEMYPDEELSITITGHSLGSALAVLSAYDIAETGLNVTMDRRGVPVSVFSFSGPRVGNVRFKERLESLGVKVLRVFNAHDLVPKSPGFFLNENLPPWLLELLQGLPWCYTHVGVDLELDHKKSPFLNPNGDGACAHNLEAHLHLLDGYHGRNHGFEPTTGRDPALVNKDCDFLKDEYSVPSSWRQYENKGMIRNKDGRWVQAERPKLVDHPEDIDHHLTQLGLASSDR